MTQNWYDLLRKTSYQSKTPTKVWTIWQIEDSRTKQTHFSIFFFSNLSPVVCQDNHSVTFLKEGTTHGSLGQLANFWCHSCVKLHLKGGLPPSWTCVWSLSTWNEFNSHLSRIFTIIFRFWDLHCLFGPSQTSGSSHVNELFTSYIPKPFTLLIINVVRPWKSLLMILLRKAHRRQANSLGTRKYTLFLVPYILSHLCVADFCHISAFGFFTSLCPRFLSHICRACVAFDCVFSVFVQSRHQLFALSGWSSCQ